MMFVVCDPDRPTRSAKACFRSRVLAIVGQFVGFLARRNAHDFDGVADDIGGALLAFRSGWHPIHLGS